MNGVRLGFAFLLRRWGQALLCVLIGALGVAAVLMVTVAERELPPAAQRAFGGVDLVIGPKGSSLDLVLCCVLHVSEPRGLIPLADAMAIVRHPLIRSAAPIALGDSIGGSRIAGTSPAILSVYKAELAAGAVWAAPFQAVLGAQAARTLKLKIGDKFAGSHGLAAGSEIHAEFPYTVTGILRPTGLALDRLVLTSLESVYQIHHHHEREEAEAKGDPPPEAAPPAATAVVAAFRSPIAMASLPRLIDATPGFSGASPVMESARLVRAGRPVIMAALAIGVMFAIIAAATAAVALTAAIGARTRDLALLRVLGAHPYELAWIAVAEAWMLSLAATLFGVLLMIVAGAQGSRLLAERNGLVFEGLPTLADIAQVLAAALVIALLAALGPAIRAARAPVEEILKP
jgi:putative ABC transport system permease protein